MNDEHNRDAAPNGAYRMIGLDEIPPARDAIDEETGLPIGEAVEKASRALLADRAISSRRLGGGVLTTDGRMTSLDFETFALPADELRPAQCVYDEDFSLTPFDASRLKPIRIVASDERWAEILAALVDADLPVEREEVAVLGDRVVILFDVSNPRDMDKLGRFVVAMRDADLLRPDVVMLLDGFDRMGAADRERTVRSACVAMDLGYDPIEAIGHAALFGRIGDVMAITGDVMNHADAHDVLEDRPMPSLAGLGAMLEVDLLRYRKRPTYRNTVIGGYAHPGASALLPERSGFDHRGANAAPRSARGQRGKRR